MLKKMQCNTYMSRIHVRVEFHLFTKARFVDEVGKREELNDGLKVTEYWAVQNMHQQLKKIIDEAVSKFVQALQPES